MITTLLAAWIPGTRLAWVVLALWLAAVVVYALWRSRGEAPQDPQRPSGPVFGS